MKIVHCKESAYDILIDRTTPFGNPFKIGIHGNRKDVIQHFRQWLPTQPELMIKIEELRNKTLGCWCKSKKNPDTACHGDVYAEMLENFPINKNKKLAVIGSRIFEDYSYLKNILNLHEPKAIISGGANGADSAANQYAKEKGLPIVIYYPDWSKGKSAGMDRNTKIIAACEEVAVFWDGISRGSKDSIDKARNLGKKIYIYKF